MRTVSFSKFFLFPLIVSGIVIILSFVSFFSRGFTLGLDFKSGHYVRIQIESVQEINAAEIERVLEKDFSQLSVNSMKESKNDFVIRFASLAGQEQSMSADEKLSEILTVSYPDFQIVQSSYISSALSKDLVKQTLFLGFISILIILVYLWFRFHLSFALAAVLALFHDVLILLGIISVFSIEMDIAVVAALLTTIGYSLNDTIVIFDRMRDNLRENTGENLLGIVDLSITQSLSRTLITSLTTFFTAFILFIFTEGSIQNFALVLVLGIIIGTYSSIFIAAPLFAFLKKRFTYIK